MTKKTKLTITALVSWLIGLGLSIYWYDWKIVIIILMFIWSNNIERSNK